MLTPIAAVHIGYYHLAYPTVGRVDKFTMINVNANMGISWATGVEEYQIARTKVIFWDGRQGVCHCTGSAWQPNTVPAIDVHDKAAAVKAFLR